MFIRSCCVTCLDAFVVQSNRFTATLRYDHTTHHPKERMRTELKLNDDHKFFVQVVDEDDLCVLINMVDIRQCTVSIEPLEVAQNRKRRWSKKFPIMVACEKALRKFKVYLFSPTAREKEDWFRRLRNAADGLTSAQLIQQQREFFAYMQKYFPATILRNLSLFPSAARRRPLSNKSSLNRSGSSSRKSANQKNVDSTLVQFSKAADVDVDEHSDVEVSGGVNITRPKGQISPNASLNRHPTSSSLSSSPVKSRTPPPTRASPSRSPTLSYRSEDDFEVVNSPPNKCPSQSGLPRNLLHPPGGGSMDLWLNSVAARLCWDIWHEQRWKDWVMSRIQKKLIKVKTPSFMEKLHLTDIAIGNDMPIVKQLAGGPRLDLRGIWIDLS